MSKRSHEQVKRLLSLRPLPRPENETYEWFVVCQILDPFLIEENTGRCAILDYFKTLKEAEKRRAFFEKNCSHESYCFKTFTFGQLFGLDVKSVKEQKATKEKSLELLSKQQIKEGSDITRLIYQAYINSTESDLLDYKAREAKKLAMKSVEAVSTLLRSNTPSHQKWREQIKLFFETQENPENYKPISEWALSLGAWSNYDDDDDDETSDSETSEIVEISTTEHKVSQLGVKYEKFLKAEESGKNEAKPSLSVARSDNNSPPIISSRLITSSSVLAPSPKHLPSPSSKSATSMPNPSPKAASATKSKNNSPTGTIK